MGASVLVVYLAVIYGTYVPDWQFTVQRNNVTVELTVSPGSFSIINIYLDDIDIILCI